MLHIFRYVLIIMAIMRRCNNHAIIVATNVDKSIIKKFMVNSIYRFLDPKKLKNCLFISNPSCVPPSPPPPLLRDVLAHIGRILTHGLINKQLFLNRRQ